MPSAHLADLRVELDGFHGPLDLLLHLVRKHEVDVLDLPIRLIADQFRDYLAAVGAIDLDAAGDFLVTAATLLEIKSRMVLPSEKVQARDDTPDAGPGEDPRRELVRQLLEYRKYREAAGRLDDLIEGQGRHRPRDPSAEPPAESAAPTVRRVELWDLVAAFARLQRETLALGSPTVAIDDQPQHVYEEWIVAKLGEGGPLPFADLFPPPRTHARLLGTFLALLQLAKDQRVVFEAGGLDELRVGLAPAVPTAEAA